MRMLFWAFRLLIILFIARLVLRTLFPGRVRGRGTRRPAPVPERAGGALVRDPECGTYVPENKAVTARDSDGTPAFFCSDRCRDAWMSAHRGAVRSA